MKDYVPVEFYRADEIKPWVETVAELIDELERLPGDLPVRQGFGDGCQLTVYNIHSDAFLEIEEVDDP